MIVFITGETGSGKTDTSWALIGALNAVFLDCDWFASRAPFAWESTADVDSVYRAIMSQIAFHMADGRTDFVITLTSQMTATFAEHQPDFREFGLPVFAFRLAADTAIVQQRILERGRDQKADECRNAMYQRELLDRMFPDNALFTSIDNTALDAGMTAQAIFANMESRSG